MPHKCMNCGETYEEDAEELIEGCECGSSLFVFEKEPGEMDEEEKTEVRSDIEEMVEEGVEDRENIKFRFDLDSIVVEDEGVYSINVSRLLEEVPLIIRKSEGTYHIHLPSAFEPEKADLDESELDI